MSQAMDEAQKLTATSTAVPSPPHPIEHKTTVPPASPDRGRVHTLAENFERMSASHYHLPVPSATATAKSPARSVASPGRSSTGPVGKFDMISPSPSKKTSFQQAAPAVHTAVDEDFDDFSTHSEGSDVFPASPGPSGEKNGGAEQHTSSSFEEPGVMAFSPGSVASPPQRTKLSISTVPQAAPYRAKVPDTPDSPWDDDSDVEESAGAGAGAGRGSGGGTDVSQSRDDEDEDTSSVDSEIRSQKRTPKADAPPASELKPTSSSSASSTVAFKPMRGPSLASVSQLTAPGLSPAKPLVSGSLLLKGRTSGPSLSNTYK